MPATIELEDFIGADNTASKIADKWQTWDNLRSKWLAEKKEVQEYIFATDTSTTTNDSLPWKNKVHIPKLCQIRDNLHANYMATLFPNDKSIVWEGDNKESETKKKKTVIQAYMRNKLKQTKFRTEVSQLVLDFIDYGNCFAMTTFEAEYMKDPQTGEQKPVYVGPRLNRIDPADIVFDPTATRFEKSPKIVRRMMTLGDLRKEISSKPEMTYLEEAFQKSIDLRGRFAPLSQGDFKKNSSFQVDGFTGFWEYFQSDYIEILDFYGDWYDPDEDKLYENYLISIIDRSFVLRKEPLDNWLGYAPIRHVGWRLRQNNLYAMGPLDNLIGLQYRINHLENSKSDAWDLYNWPLTKVKGEVSDFNYGPNQRVYMDVDGDVEFMRPDPTFLNADTQVEMYERKMEEMAGAPREAVGFRTPGEKTAYEIQVLENGANKVFVNKVSFFEEMFLEPCLNDMLAASCKNLSEKDMIRVFDDKTKATIFKSVSREDITASGKLRPMGARHFAQNATILQNINQFANSPLAQDPTINSHISGKRLASAIEVLLGLEDFDLVQENIRLYEAQELQEVQGSLAQAGMEKQTAGMSAEGALAVMRDQAAQEEAQNGQNTTKQQ